MKKSLILVNSVVGAALLTLVVAVFTLLYLMFSTGEQVARREGLFGSLFFETREVRPGVTGATMGVDNPTGLAVVFALLCLVLLFYQVIFRALKQYRAHLIRQGTVNI